MKNKLILVAVIFIIAFLGLAFIGCFPRGVCQNSYCCESVRDDCRAANYKDGKCTLCGSDCCPTPN